MKIIKFTLLTITLLSLMGWSNNSNAQTLFKDLNTAANVSSDPDQFMNVNGTMYFVAWTRPGRNYQLWKSDGTALNTVLVQDSIITTNVGKAVYIRTNMNGYLYYSVNSQGISAGSLTKLWKTNGSSPILVDSLIHGGGYPTSFISLGNKIFFIMDYQLWVTDGTKAGTMPLAAASNKPIVAFKSKVYFQGATTELYSSDGTTLGTTLLKASMYGAENLIVYKNELYFGINSGAELWKTNGNAIGTIKIANTNFSPATIFKNELYYGSSNKLSKSDGTDLGTVVVKDTAGTITGANNDYFFTLYLASLSVPPYYELVYSRSDGSTSGTMKVSKKLGASASFQVLNNIMYNTVADTGGVFTSGLYGTDGTESGTSKLDGGYLTAPFIYNSTVFYSKQQSIIGTELWSLNPAGTGISEIWNSNSELKIYPNPSSGIIYLNWKGENTATLKVFNMLGKMVLSQVVSSEIDLSNQAKGIYFIEVNNGINKYNQKIIIQ